MQSSWHRSSFVLWYMYCETCTFWAPPKRKDCLCSCGYSVYIGLYSSLSFPLWGWNSSFNLITCLFLIFHPSYYGMEGFCFSLTFFKYWGGKGLFYRIYLFIYFAHKLKWWYKSNTVFKIESFVSFLSTLAQTDWFFSSQSWRKRRMFSLTPSILPWVDNDLCSNCWGPEADIAYSCIQFLMQRDTIDLPKARLTV